ncbi:amino acid transporter [Pholiota conissans]|uniref:Amino acid transporter n=1 Tax=Pholiota conissans TaxID=109636 RepID=A0A9P5YY62_9AGAR|nr:amino acid transporter [Pholiota conissans]
MHTPIYKYRTFLLCRLSAFPTSTLQFIDRHKWTDFTPTTLRIMLHESDLRPPQAVTQKNEKDSEDLTSAQDESDKRLLELGYRSEFRREMSLFGVLGMSFCAIGILTGMSSAFQTGLFSGGPLGLFWGWNICSLFMLLIALSLAEICSAYPTMGGLYFWVCRMKPDAPALGFCTGWIYTIAMMLTGTSGNLSVALYLASLVEIGQQITLTRVEIAAIAWGVNILSGIINTVGTKAIGRMSSFNVWWTIGGTFVLVITLLTKAPTKNDASFVFTDYENFTGWGSEGFVVLLGFLQAVYTLEGCETAAQVAEEAKRAEFLAPVAVVGSIVGSWIIGLAYMLALLFSVQSIAGVQSTTYAIPIAQLYFDAVGQRLTLMCLTVIALAQFTAAATAFTASSRLMYALARDNAAPMKRHFMLLNRFQAPYVGIWLSVLVGCVISCAYIGSVIAFNAILSSAAISVMLGYAQPIIIRVFWPAAMKERGPFHLGKWSMVINIASLSFIVFICVLFVLPTTRPVTQFNMNYAIVSVGGIFLIVGFAWVFWGRTRFRGSVQTKDGSVHDSDKLDTTDVLPSEMLHAA